MIGGRGFERQEDLSGVEIRRSRRVWTSGIEDAGMSRKDHG